MVVCDIFCRERTVKQDSRGKAPQRQSWRRPTQSCHRPVPSGLSLGEKTASFHSCGNLIGSLFLAARSQTENLLPRFCFKVFSSGRLSLTFSLSHRANGLAPPRASPSSRLMHLLLPLSPCILIICLQLSFPTQTRHIFSTSQHTV